MNFFEKVENKSLMRIKRETVFSPCKINIFLEVQSKRKDGYHDIDTVMQKVTYSDMISVEIKKGSGISVDCDTEGIPLGEDNICYKAAESYLATASRDDLAVSIYIHKKIPTEAGLGGASSDAAGVLLALNRMLKALSSEALLSLSAKIGADVPFFMDERTGCKRCEGIGEILTPVKPLSSRLYLVVAKGTMGVKTGNAYALLDSFDYEKRDSQKIVKALSEKSLDDTVNEFYNTFERVVEPLCPDVSEIKRILLENSSDGALMSGSGPSVFGVFKKGKDADRAREALLRAGYTAFICRPMK